MNRNFSRNRQVFTAVCGVYATGVVYSASFRGTVKYLELARDGSDWDEEKSWRVFAATADGVGRGLATPMWAWCESLKWCLQLEGE